MQNNVNSNISWYEGHNITSLGKILKNFKILCTKYMASSEVMTSSTHSFAYLYRLVKKCFVKICETSNCHNFLIFQPIFIRFSLLCLTIFTLSSEIKLNLLWSYDMTYTYIIHEPTKAFREIEKWGYLYCINKEDVEEEGEKTKMNRQVDQNSTMVPR